MAQQASAQQPPSLNIAGKRPIDVSYSGEGDLRNNTNDGVIDRSGAIVLAKRVKGDGNYNQQLATTRQNKPVDDAIIEYGPTKLVRTSSLSAPTVLLEGHEAEIMCAKYHPDGSVIASSGAERLILLWQTYDECRNYAKLRAHTGTIQSLDFSGGAGDYLFSASVDKTLGVWDYNTGALIRRLKGHTSYVNVCSAAPSSAGQPHTVCSGADDGTVRVWDARQKRVVQSFTSGFAVTACAMIGAGAEQIVSGGIDNELKVWDRRKSLAQVYSMKGHADTVTGLAASPNGNFVLSNSMDNTARVWDIKPYCPTSDRCVRLFRGHLHSYEKNLLKCCWSRDGTKISCGSSDAYVYVWDYNTTRILLKLPGHKGSVNETAFHPTEPVILSASSDKCIYVGEFNL